MTCCWRRTLFRKVGAALLFAITATAAVAQADDREFVTVELKPVVAVNSRVVLIGDIAEVDAGNRWSADKVARLDIADPPVVDQPLWLRRSQVEIRLRLAGYTRNQFQVVGADATQVTYDSAPIDDATVIAAVRASFARQLNVAPGDVQLVLLNPLQLRGDYAHVMPDDLRLDVRLPTSVRTKVLNAKIGIHFRDRLYEVAQVSFDAKIHARVPQARRAIRVGDVFSEANLGYEQTYVDAESLSRVARNPIGKRSNQNLQAGRIVESQHIMSLAQSDREILVRPRDLVLVIAQRGSLRIKMKDASALEMGRRGDTVRVRNSKTNKVLQGRVTGLRVVEVPL